MISTVHCLATGIIYNNLAPFRQVGSNSRKTWVCFSLIFYRQRCIVCVYQFTMAGRWAGAPSSGSNAASWEWQTDGWRSPQTPVAEISNEMLLQDMKELHEAQRVVQEHLNELRADVVSMHSAMTANQEKQDYLNDELKTLMEQVVEVLQSRRTLETTAGDRPAAGSGGYDGEIEWPPPRFEAWGVAAVDDRILCDAGVEPMHLKSAKKDPLLWLDGDTVKCKWCNTSQWSDSHFIGKTHIANRKKCFQRWMAYGNAQTQGCPDGKLAFEQFFRYGSLGLRSVSHELMV